jgi:hypothetical protein
VSPHLGASLVLAVGALYGRVAHFGPRWAALTAAGLAAAIACLLLWRKRRPAPAGARLADYLTGRPSRFRDWILLGLGCIGLLLALDFDGFTRGFFRQDDFAFVQDARDGTLGQQVRLYHNDHSLPLYRVEVWAMVQAAGPHASASDLAAVFNLVNFLTFLGVLLGGCWVLAELSARRATLAAFCLFAWFWPSWGEFTSGLYTISVYPQTLVCGFAAVALWLRGGRLASGFCLALSLLAAASGAALDIFGVWIFPALACFAWAASRRSAAKTPRGYLAGLAVVFVFAAAYHLVLAKHPLGGRELVQNPQAKLLSYGAPQIAALLSWKTARGLIYGLGGTVLSTVTPPFLQILAPHLGRHPSYGALLGGADAIATFGAGWLLWNYGRRLPAANRPLFFALLWPAVLTVGMAVIARPMVAGQPGLLWPTKYLPLPYCWLVLTAVFLVDRLGFIDPPRSRRTLRWLGAAVSVGVWLSLSHWYLERSLALNYPWMPGGRYHNSQIAVIRRANFTAYENDVKRLASLAGTSQLALPIPTGGYWYYGFLEEGSDPQYGSTYFFADLLSVAPDVPIKIIAQPVGSISAPTLAALRRLPELDGFFESKSGPPVSE